MADTFPCDKIGKLKASPKHSKDDENKYVTKVQTQLAAWGFYAKDKIDGDYGPVTAGAVKKFQQKYGLDDDGVFGPKQTCPKFNSLLKTETKKTEETKNQESTKIYGIDCNKIVGNNEQYMETSQNKKKNDAKIVKEIQKHLRNIGYYHMDRSGVFGEFTDRALIRFQKKYNQDHNNAELDEDGYFNLLTCQKLKKIIEDKKLKYGIDCNKVDKNVPHKTSPTNDTKVVQELQSHLKTLGYFSEHDKEGTFGEYTKSAVIKFQKNMNSAYNAGLSEDGIFDKDTCKQLKLTIEGRPKVTPKAPSPDVQYKPNTDKNVIPVDSANISFDGIFLNVSKLTPIKHYRGGNWKTIDFLEGSLPYLTKDTPLEYNIECYLTNEEFGILDLELEKIGHRICNVVSTLQLRTGKYWVQVDVAPQKLTHQKITLKLTEALGV